MCNNKSCGTNAKRVFFFFFIAIWIQPSTLETTQFRKFCMTSISTLNTRSALTCKCRQIRRRIIARLASTWIVTWLPPSLRQCSIGGVLRWECGSTSEQHINPYRRRRRCTSLSTAKVKTTLSRAFSGSMQSFSKSQTPALLRPKPL
jgi:hypothetical protein